MKNVFTILFIFICLCAAGLTQKVMVMSTSFSPPFFMVTTGDTIIWINYQGSHSITSGNIPDGAEKFSKLLESNGSMLQYIVQVPGDYTYQSNVASSEGMSGSFHAKEKTKTENTELLKLQSNRVANYVSFDSPVSLRITPAVKDITGKTIRQFSSMESDESLYVGDLSNGVYILEIRTGNEIQNLRFVKIDDMANM